MSVAVLQSNFAYKNRQQSRFGQQAVSSQPLVSHDVPITQYCPYRPGELDAMCRGWRFRKKKKKRFHSYNVEYKKHTSTRHSGDQEEDRLCQLYTFGDNQLLRGEQGSCNQRMRSYDCPSLLD